MCQTKKWSNIYKSSVWIEASYKIKFLKRHFTWLIYNYTSSRSDCYMSIYLPQSLPSTLNPHPKQVIKKKKKNETKENTRDEEWCVDLLFLKHSCPVVGLPLCSKAKTLQRPFVGTDSGGDHVGSQVQSWRTAAKRGRWGGRRGEEQQGRRLSWENRKPVLMKEVPELITPSVLAGPDSEGVLCVYSVHIFSLNPVILH